MRKIAIAFILLALSGTAHAGMVTLNRQAVVEDELIVLGDLFLNTGEKSEIPVGYAPDLGRRAVYDANWLNRLARAHQLDWQATSRFDRVIVERASQTIEFGAIEAELMAALALAGVDVGHEVVIDNRGIRLSIPVNTPATVEFRELRYDRITGRFTGKVGAPAGEPVAFAAISGRVHETVDVPVPLRRIARGEVIREDDLAWIKFRVGRLTRDTVMDLEAIVGMTPRRALSPDKPIPGSDIQRPVVIAKNSIVIMTLRVANMIISAQGRAMDDGAMGDTIRVMNTHSQRIIDAEVSGPDAVIVWSGTRLAAVQE